MAEPAQSMHKVAVAGASGRMGHMLIEAIRASGDCQLAGALDIASSPAIGNDAAAFLGHASGVPVSADARTALANAQVLIDFTRPEGTLAHLKACRERGANAVIGTTGFTEDQKAQIEDAARDIADRHGAQHERGRERDDEAAADGRAGAGDRLRHRDHRGAPPPQGGRAFGHRAQDGRSGRPGARPQPQGLRRVRSREGVTGERDPSTIGFASVRGGDIVGDHTVLFAGTGERIEITHKAASRATYAQGSLRAVRFLAGRKSGLFDMFDVLDLR